jgi:hypothetical protein
VGCRHHTDTGRAPQVSWLDWIDRARHHLICHPPIRLSRRVAVVFFSFFPPEISIHQSSVCVLWAGSHVLLRPICYKALVLDLMGSADLDGARVSVAARAGVPAHRARLPRRARAATSSSRRTFSWTQWTGRRASATSARRACWAWASV